MRSGGGMYGANGGRATSVDPRGARTSPGGASARPHRVGEPIEEIKRIVRPGGRLRVVLHAERAEVGGGQPFARPVVQVDVGGADRRRQTLQVDAEAVVLGRDLDP